MNTKTSFKKILSWMLGSIASEIFIRSLAAIISAAIFIWKLYTPAIQKGLGDMNIPLF